MKTIDFSTVADGKAKAAEVIGRSGLNVASFHALEANASGSTFPSQVEFVNEVHSRLRKRTEALALKYGEDNVI